MRGRWTTRKSCELGRAFERLAKPKLVWAVDDEYPALDLLHGLKVRGLPKW